jgi:hypothetical protein
MADTVTVFEPVDEQTEWWLERADYDEGDGPNDEDD